MQVTEGNKVKVSAGRKRKNKDKNLVGREKPEDVEVDLEEQNSELMTVAWLLYCDCEQDILPSISV